MSLVSRQISRTTPVSQLHKMNRWQKLRRWLRPPRKIKATSTGKVLLVFTVLLGAAAVNTGNNLLYLMLGALFGLISASGILSERSMRNLHVVRSIPGLVFARTDCEMVYEVVNQKRKAYAYLIEIGEANGSLVLPTLFRRINPVASLARRTTFKIPLRGPFHLEAIKVSTRYPFDFYRRSYRIETPFESWAAPTPVRHGSAPKDRSTDGNRTNRGVTGSRDFDRVRPMAEGDSLRQIHWKKTAATGEWMVRDGEKSGGSAIALALSHVEDERDLENMTWWILDYLAKGRAVNVLLGGDRFAISSNGTNLRTVMRALAYYPITDPHA